MASIGRTTVGLRFFGDDLAPGELTLLLGAQPSSTRVKGTVRTSPTTGRQATAKASSWILYSDLPESEELASHIRGIFDATTKDLAVWRDLSRRYTADLFVGLFLESTNEGFTLDHAVAASIADRRLDLHVDIYALTEDETGS